MKTQIIIKIILPVIILVSCGPVAIPVTITSAIPGVISTLTPSLPVPTSTLTPIPATASPLPTNPRVTLITPDSAQLERWREYETALAKTFLPFLPPDEVLCEWELLGQSDQEVYVWAECRSTIPIGDTGQFSGADIPAVIHLGTDGVVQSVKIPGAGTDYGPDIRKMFPLDVQVMIFGRLIDFNRLSAHLEWRRDHPEEPPLIVFDATLTP
jgi:hypothetical protein